MNLTKTILYTVGIFIILSSCSFSPKSEKERMSEVYSDAMAYEVSYISRVNIDYCKDGELTISSLTENYSFDENSWEWASNNFPKLEQKTWGNFLQVNSQSIPFPNDLDLGCKYILLDIKQSPLDWSQENCIGINYFSQIGFNSRNNQALVYRSVSCGDFGAGYLYFVELIDGHWVVTDRADVFIT